MREVVPRIRATNNLCKIIQMFQNFFVSRIDKLILDMEENSLKLVDQLYDMKSINKGKK